MKTRRVCRYPNCDRFAMPRWTMCPAHHSAGMSLVAWNRIQESIRRTTEARERNAVSRADARKEDEAAEILRDFDKGRISARMRDSLLASLGYDYVKRGGAR